MKEKNMHVFEVIYIKKIGGPQYVQCSNKYYIHNTGIERVGTVHSIFSYPYVCFAAVSSGL